MSRVEWAHLLRQVELLRAGLTFPRLVAASLGLWLLITCFAPEIAASRAELRLAVDVEWRPGWVGPWLLAAAAIALSHARRRRRGSDDAGSEMTRRLQQLTALAGGFALLRALSLWDPLGTVLPWLSVLWSPHASWALAAAYPIGLHLPASGGRLGDRESADTARGTTRVALCVFGAAATLYSAYALYFCQLGMARGGEAHYLRVTQSLLRDGDIDLANNLDPEAAKEFRDHSFGVHKAPSSPADKVYSVHPAGTSLMLLPAYWIGLELWSNPRLACALFMSLMAAACVALSYVWLARIGVDRAAALMSAICMGATGPLFFYSSQLFPDLPALLVILFGLTMLSSWQRPGGRYGPLGPGEPALLVLIALSLTALPFLHPRFAVAAAALSILVALQAWHHSRRHLVVALVAAIGLAGVAAHITFNLHISDDWLGAFRPGNAWGDDALQLSTWVTALPGQWLDAQIGLLNTSPVFLLCPIGWIIMARGRDRRLLTAAIAFGATAAVNALHPMWSFGFGFPARFLITAMPALLLGLALALSRLRQSATGLLAFFLLMAIGLDSVAAALRLPESGYLGYSLADRAIGDYYPLAVHFTPEGERTLPLADLSFWLVALACAAVVLSNLRPSIRLAALAVAAVAPTLWSSLDTVSSRLAVAVRPGVAALTRDGSRSQDVATAEFILSQTENVRGLAVGEQLPDGRISAPGPAPSAGLVRSYRMSYVTAGSHRVSVSGLELARLGSEVQGHLVVRLRDTPPTVSSWETRLSLPLFSDTAHPELNFHLPRIAAGFAHIEYTGRGPLAYREVRHRFQPRRTSFRATSSRSFDDNHIPPPAGRDDLFGVNVPQLAPGHYRARFEIDGFPLGSWFERHPEPIVMAVYAAPAEAQTEREKQLDSVKFWLQDNREEFAVIAHPDFRRPQVESVQPPWWLTVPFAGERSRELVFALPGPSHVWLLMKYSGPEDLPLTGVTLESLAAPLPATPAY